MKPFNNLELGMSLIEVMIAIALLATFGTSLFMMQQYLFNRMELSQLQVIANMRMQQELVVYQKKMLEEFLKDGFVDKSLEEQSREFTAPAMTIVVSALSDFDKKTKNMQMDKNKSRSFKDYENLYFISARAHDVDHQYGPLSVFVCLPKMEKA
ncbi:MAG: PulJ/GspJ family protein [Candidatus Chromulinivorax sp.]